jgi:alpha-tubulin suppressor-like RCC1 family protein
MTERLTPTISLITDVAELAAADSATCARKNNGSVLCWGQNDAGSLGDGTNVSRATPGVVSGLSARVTTLASSTGPYGTSCAVVAGAVKCWGNNSVGQVGTGSRTFKEVTPVAISGLTNVQALALGGHSCALLATGTATCWGPNLVGQLGDGTKTDHLTPAPVVGLTGISKLRAGDTVTCAIQSNGRLWCWGLNDYANVGDRVPSVGHALPVPVQL